MLLRRVRLTVLMAAAAVAAGHAARVKSSWPSGLQQTPGDSPPLSPEEALKRFHLPPGYRVEIAASEPLVQDPVMIDWDGDGRMWVVEMPGYMADINASVERAPVGKVVVQDTRRYARSRTIGAVDSTRTRTNRNSPSVAMARSSRMRVTLGCSRSSATRPNIPTRTRLTCPS